MLFQTNTKMQTEKYMISQWEDASTTQTTKTSNKKANLLTYRGPKFLHCLKIGMIYDSCRHFLSRWRLRLRCSLYPNNEKNVVPVKPIDVWEFPALENNPTNKPQPYTVTLSKRPWKSDCVTHFQARVFSKCINTSLSSCSHLVVKEQNQFSTPTDCNQQ